MKKQIEVEAFVDRDGNPTCSTNNTQEETCIFFRTERFGLNETCVFAKREGKYLEVLKRGGDGHGYLQPLEQCPIWGNK